MEHFEYMDTILSDYHEWEAFEADMATDPYDEEEWPDDLWEDEGEEPEGDWDTPFASDLDMGFDPYMGCYTDDC